MNSFTKTVDLLQRAMGANVVRRSVIANNLPPVFADVTKEKYNGGL